MKDNLQSNLKFNLCVAVQKIKAPPRKFTSMLQLVTMARNPTRNNSYTSEIIVVLLFLFYEFCYIQISGFKSFVQCSGFSNGICFGLFGFVVILLTFLQFQNIREEKEIRFYFYAKQNKHLYTILTFNL